MLYRLSDDQAVFIQMAVGFYVGARVREGRVSKEKLFEMAESIADAMWEPIREEDDK